MFIGWLKYTDVNNMVTIANDVGWLVDGYHIKLMIMHSPHLCYGAYDKGKLVGAIMAIEFEKSAQMKYFMVKSEYQHQGIGRRLANTLISVLKNDYQKIFLHSNPDMVAFFQSYGFEKNIDIGRYVNVGKVPPFHFTNAHAKELDSGDFDTIIKRIDKETFGEDRLTFLAEEMDRHSSLKFALPNGFQHSSVINAKQVYLGPWQVRADYEEEAEKFMKGVLYFRGLKKIVADIPLGFKPITQLYEKYHFEKKQKFVHMCYGGCAIKFENIYAFSL